MNTGVGLCRPPSRRKTDQPCARPTGPGALGGRIASGCCRRPCWGARGRGRPGETVLVRTRRASRGESQAGGRAGGGHGSPSPSGPRGGRGAFCQVRPHTSGYRAWTLAAPRSRSSQHPRTTRPPALGGGPQAGQGEGRRAVCPGGPAPNPRGRPMRGPEPPGQDTHLSSERWSSRTRPRSSCRRSTRVGTVTTARLSHVTRGRVPNIGRWTEDRPGPAPGPSSRPLHAHPQLPVPVLMPLTPRPGQSLQGLPAPTKRDLRPDRSLTARRRARLPL